jgi:hypothetical protein
VSRQFEHTWSYGIRCDFPGCEVTLWRVAGSEQMAHTKAQQDAKGLRWKVAVDRLVSNEDLCPDHAQGAKGMLW